MGIRGVLWDGAGAGGWNLRGECDLADDCGLAGEGGLPLVGEGGRKADLVGDAGSCLGGAGKFDRVNTDAASEGARCRAAALLDGAVCERELIGGA